MKKLTVEQKEWLIELLSTHNGKLEKDEFYDVSKCIHWLDKERVEKIINQCTEKPFPAFEIKDLEDSEIYVADPTGSLIQPEGFAVWIGCPDGGVRLNKEQFKQFTEGCNKVVECLDNDSEV